LEIIAAALPALFKSTRDVAITMVAEAFEQGKQRDQAEAKAKADAIAEDKARAEAKVKETKLAKAA
jgi:hypothetical protein